MAYEDSGSSDGFIQTLNITVPQGNVTTTPDLTIYWNGTFDTPPSN